MATDSDTTRNADCEAVAAAAKAAAESAEKVALGAYRLQRRLLNVDNDPFFVSRMVEQIIACLGALATSKRWLEVRSTLEQHLPRVEELVCYCLGSLGDLSISYQLAFLLLLANHFEICPSRRFVFDPVHGDKDRQVLQMCGFTPLTWNESGKHRAHCGTLFYMPFAPFDLTDSVVRANWQALHKTAIIGNRLAFVTGEVFKEESARRAACTQAARGLAVEVTLWEDDLRTWSMPDLDASAERSEHLGDNVTPPPKELSHLASTLNSTLVTFRSAPSNWPLHPPHEQSRGAKSDQSKLLRSNL